MNMRKIATRRRRRRREQGEMSGSVMHRSISTMTVSMPASSPSSSTSPAASTSSWVAVASSVRRTLNRNRRTVEDTVDIEGDGRIGSDGVTDRLEKLLSHGGATGRAILVGERRYDPHRNGRFAGERVPHVLQLNVRRDGDLVTLVVEVSDGRGTFVELEALGERGSKVWPRRDGLKGKGKDASFVTARKLERDRGGHDLRVECGEKEKAKRA